jgi:hypothetical protein
MSGHEALGGHPSHDVHAQTIHEHKGNLLRFPNDLGDRLRGWASGNIRNPQPLRCGSDQIDDVGFVIPRKNEFPALQFLFQPGIDVDSSCVSVCDLWIIVA